MGEQDLSDKIDWEALAREMGLLHGGGAGGTESAGSNDARAALDLILGHAAIRDSVDHYVSYRPGSELARAVLRIYGSPAAMERCYELFREPGDVNRRRSAVELLRMVADDRALEWVPEFLNDPDEGIQNWGIGVVDQLLFVGAVGIDRCQALLELAAKHPSAYVRDMVRSIRADAQRGGGGGGGGSVGPGPP
jgi:hypothetical protein